MNYMTFRGKRILVTQNKHDCKYLKKKITSKKMEIRLIWKWFRNNLNLETSFKSVLTLGFVGRIRKDKEF